MAPDLTGRAGGGEVSAVTYWRGSSSRRWHLTRAQKQRLWQILCQIEDLHEHAVLQLYLRDIQNQLGRTLGVLKHQNSDYTIWSLVEACAEDADAFWSLVTVVQMFNADHVMAADLRRFVDDLDSLVLKSGQRRELLALLNDATVRQINTAFRDTVDHGVREVTTNQGEFPSALDRVEFSASQHGGLSTMLSFVDALQRGSSDLRWNERLAAWIDAVSAGDDIGLPRFRSLSTDRPAADPPTDANRGVEPLGEDVNQTTVVTRVTQEPVGNEPPRRIWSGVPVRNPHFTGRQGVLRRLREALTTSTSVSVVPQVLFGMSGVGKSQLVSEYVYRHAGDYQIIWWLPADDPSAVRSSLAELGGRIGVPPSQDIHQTAVAVLDALATWPGAWLLIFDNADQPDGLASLIPSAGGHVILTSRSEEWSTHFSAIQVEVLSRPESVQLIQRRGSGISTDDAERLAARLGDLPLALEQAATWQAASRMSASHYLKRLDTHIEELLNEGKPPSYPAPLFAILKVAFQRLREHSERAGDGADEMLELFAFLGNEPVSVELLRAGHNAELSEGLRRALTDELVFGRAIRELRRYSLVKTNPADQQLADQQLSVHSLVAQVMRQDLRNESQTRGHRNVRLILAAANPRRPDNPRSWQRYASIGPHLAAAGMVEAPLVEQRQVVLDHARYLFQIGEFTGSRSLCQSLVDKWSRPRAEGGLGPDDEQTLVAQRDLANALRVLGNHRRAREIDYDTLKRLQDNPLVGNDHEHTFRVALGLGFDLRVLGQLEEALRSDQENLARALRVYGEEDDEMVLRAKNNIAVSLRMLGRFDEAYSVDLDITNRWRQTQWEGHPQILFATNGLASDLFQLGRWSQALDRLQRALRTYQFQLDPQHLHVLSARQSEAVTLIKLGRHDEAIDQARECYRGYHLRFGSEHQNTLAATVSYANALRATGQTAEARSLAADAVAVYQQNLGERHLLSLVAYTNLAVIYRTVGDHRSARALDELTYPAMSEVLGAEHPFTLCSGTGLAHDLAVRNDLPAALEMDQHMLSLSRRVRGDRHPYTWACAVNAAWSLRATGNSTAADQLHGEAVEAMQEYLGADHPDAVAAQAGRRIECDIEPPGL